MLPGLGPLHGRRSCWWIANPAGQALAVLLPHGGKASGSGEERGCRQPGCFLGILSTWSSGSAWDGDEAFGAQLELQGQGPASPAAFPSMAGAGTAAGFASVINMVPG